MPLHLTYAEFKKRIQTFQWSLLIVNVLVIAIGGCVFGLGVATRPILRVIDPSYFSEIRSICNLLAATGIVQIIVACYDIFAGCWCLLKPLYLSLLFTGVAVILEMVAIASLFYINSQSEVIVSENIYRPWFVFECVKDGSCREAAAGYVKSIMMPLVGLAMVSIVLQCLAFLYLIKLIRTIRQKIEDLMRAKASFDTEYNLTRKGTLDKKKDQNDNNNISMDTFGDEDEDEEGPKTPSTPISILKEEHGYVAAPGTSIDKDYDDVSVVRNRSKPVNQKEAHSLSFNTNVEIHLFSTQDQDNEERTSHTTRF